MSDRDTGGRAVALSRRVLFGEQPDPRVLQAVFTVIFALDLGLRQVAGPAGGMGRWPIASVPVIVVAGVLAVTVPWSRVSSTALAVVPLLDLAALGMSRMNPDSSGAGILVVVPALWLGRTLGRRGALVVLLGSSLLTALPPIIYLHGGGGPVLGRSILVPVVATWAALAVVVNRERARDGLAEADLRREQLDAARGTIEHQRRVAAAILDTVDVGLVLLDAEGAYESMNKRHADFIRLAFPDGHQGRAGQVGLVFHEDGTTPVRAEEMPSYRASRGEEFDDCRIWCGDDPVTRRALSVSARSVRDGDGRFTGAALAYKDVTDFMRALRVKDDFVASVSHELRTPLTSIMGYVNILLETDEVCGEPRRQLEVVARNSDRLRRLVSDLLHTARFDVEPLTVVRQPSDLSRIVRDALEAATPVATSSRVTIHHELPERVSLLIDAERMAQAVDNLLSNAIKYTPAGGEVRVWLTVDESRVELGVADTGIGIAPADREQLFTRFFRARHAVEQAIQGVGLGLAITRDIVEGHGGRIEVESEVGRGTEFRVRLPLDVPA